MSFKQEIGLQVQFTWGVIPKSLDFHYGNQKKLAVFVIKQETYSENEIYAHKALWDEVY